MNPSAFWVMDASIAFAGAALIMVLAKPLTRAIEPERLA
jgi:hypothetical protein